MFKKTKVKINPNTTDTLIGEGSVFEGRIKSEASLRVEGQIIGDIECLGDVSIGEHGVAKSNILARNITIAGTVNGNVNTKGTLSITETGRLNGNISAGSFIIAEGGVFLGNSKMDSRTSGGHAEAEKNAQNFNQNYNNTSASL